MDAGEDKKTGSEPQLEPPGPPSEERDESRGEPVIEERILEEGGRGAPGEEDAEKQQSGGPVVMQPTVRPGPQVVPPVPPPVGGPEVEGRAPAPPTPPEPPSEAPPRPAAPGPVEPPRPAVPSRELYTPESPEEELPLLPPVPPKRRKLEPAGEEWRWRNDVKWIFGVLAAIFLLLALLAAGLYRVTAFGNSRKIVVPVLGEVSEINDIVAENYDDVRSQARRKEGARIAVPDLEPDVAIESSVILETDLKGLQTEVTDQVFKYLYAKGYKGMLPLVTPKGSGETRSQAIIELSLGFHSDGTHSFLVWPLSITGALALAAGVLLLLFARGWGKAAAAGIVMICAALPFSLGIRLCSDFIFKGAKEGAVYESALNGMVSTAGSMRVVYFDIALAVGGLLLLVGVVGGLYSRRREKKEIPFSELD